MKHKLLDISIFVLSLISLVISLKLMWNMGIFVDEYNMTPRYVCGGDFWLIMDWLRLLFLAMLSILSGINIFKRK